MSNFLRGTDPGKFFMDLVGLGLLVIALPVTIFKALKK